MMRLAFCLNYFFPYGGLQRDFLHIVEAAVEKGHDIDVYTMAWEGEYLAGVKIHLLPVKGFSNDARCLAYIKSLEKILKRKQHDVVIGFNKIPGLDIYYAADPCFLAKLKPYDFVKYLLPRYRTYRELEASVFNQDKKTQILSLAPQQQALYQHYYQTDEKRFHCLPPPLHPSRQPTESDETLSRELRETLADNKKNVLVIVASAFKTKGLDRVLRALKALPRYVRNETMLWVIGDDQKRWYVLWNLFRGLIKHVKFLGARNDLPAICLAADLMVHPARTENTGTVLLEAMVAGCPIITSGNCGYAHYVEAGQGGIVLETPFSQKKLNETLIRVLTEERSQLKVWGAMGQNYAMQSDWFSMPSKALEVIEGLGIKDA